jgi:hypothetical protein
MIVGWGKQREYEEGDDHDLEPILGFTKVYAAYEIVKSFLYAHTISKTFPTWIWCWFVRNVRLQLNIVNYWIFFETKKIECRY